MCPVTTVSFKASIERYVSNLPLLLDPPLRSLDDVFDVVPPFIGDWESLPLWEVLGLGDFPLEFSRTTFP